MQDTERSVNVDPLDALKDERDNRAGMLKIMQSQLWQTRRDLQRAEDELDAMLDSSASLDDFEAALAEAHRRIASLRERERILADDLVKVRENAQAIAVSYARQAATRDASAIRIALGAHLDRVEAAHARYRTELTGLAEEADELRTRVAQLPGLLLAIPEVEPIKHFRTSGFAAMAATISKLAPAEPRTAAAALRPLGMGVGAVPAAPTPAGG